MISRSLFAAVLLASSALAGPPLTTIQDVLYKADGRRFAGTLTISWTSFESIDKSAIAAQSTTVTVTNGQLWAQLVPTTTAVPAAHYAVTYNSDGHIQFSEIWAVPSSATPLRVRDVRIASADAGTVSSETSTTPIQESEVVGLIADLGARPLKGPGYAAGRVAVVNSTGSLESVSGSPSDCVRVDGTSGPCGGSLPGFIDSEPPSGIVDGSNNTFGLSSTPDPVSSLAVHLNGVLQKVGQDYNVNGNSVQFVAAAVPQPGDTLLASYRVRGSDTLPAPPSLISPQQIDPAGLTAGQSWLWDGSSYVPGSALQSTGSYNDPAWLSISKGKVGLSNVENTALSTWSGTSSLTTIGTLAAGTVPWARLTNVPANFAPASHAGTHAAAGSDPVTPAAIGAVARSSKDQPNGYVGLDANGHASLGTDAPPASAPNGSLSAQALYVPFSVYRAKAPFQNYVGDHGAFQAALDWAAPIPYRDFAIGRCANLFCGSSFDIFYINANYPTSVLSSGVGIGATTLLLNTVLALGTGTKALIGTITAGNQEEVTVIAGGGTTSLITEATVYAHSAGELVTVLGDFTRQPTISLAPSAVQNTNMRLTINGDPLNQPRMGGLEIDAVGGWSGGDAIVVRDGWFGSGSVRHRINKEYAQTIISNAVNRSVTDGVLNSTTTLTSANIACTDDDYGKIITATGIPAGTYIADCANSSTVTLSQAATTTATGVSVTVWGSSWRVQSFGNRPFGWIGAGFGAGVAQFPVLNTCFGPGCTPTTSSAFSVEGSDGSDVTAHVGSSSKGSLYLSALGASFKASVSSGWDLDVKASSSLALASGGSNAIVCGATQDCTFSKPPVAPTTTPVSASAACTTGAIWADANFVYVCTASGAIKRAPIASW